ncbi:amino acid adenylation domain-containing protein [Verminephrobacter eiseniae]|uniref:non-ribosomal peptide synthetase n=1 Tax=Verminephrobacter eiseniae TaxID=364317 RepID=UPI002238678D|nr:non-ribosomal peptide synthetase [Verminephrobacter eiseniae]MCW5260616.1 amino acid adenylation domain-containing protein [Verminephrobacter eiseniae]
MSATELVTQLEALGVQIWEEAGELRFRAPRGVMNDERRAAVRDHRDSVIEHLRRQAEAAVIQPAPQERHEPFPLTDVQSAYLLGRQDVFAYGGVGCQVYAELRLPELDSARLEAAWNRLVAHHDMLRATVRAEGFQQVMPEAPHYALAVRDLRAAPAKAFDDAVAERRENMAHGAFVPEVWPLFAVSVTQGADHALVHVAIDFLIADYMSVQMLLSELAALYREPARESVPIGLSFRDYVLAERRQRASVQYRRDRDHWMQRLATLPSAPDLPLLAQAESSTGRFSRIGLTLERDAWTGFKKRAGRHDLTPSIAVLAAYAAIVARWSRGDRFLLNLTLLNRQPLHADVQELVGDFTSVGLLAVETVAGRHFADEARAIQSQLWQDMDHRLFSGVEVVRELARQRGQAAALMPVVFTSTIGLNESAIELGTPVYGLSLTPQVWLDCQAIEREDTLVLQWDIRDGVLPAGMAQDMFTAMGDLLAHLAADDTAWTLEEPLPLPPAQREDRLAANATAVPAPTGLLHEGFFAQAAATPERPAVIDGETTISYGALAAAAGGIARALRETGVEPGERIAVALPTGWLQVAAVLGVHLAGAAYLPLDLRQPALRRDRILRDAEVRIVLAQPEATWPDGLRVLDPAALSRARPQATPGTTPDALAYVIYTSGSTGHPKGVMIAHGAALNTVADINRRLAVGPDDRVFGLASLGFDLSVYDIFGPLAVGGALVLPEASQRDDPSHWCEVIARHGVTLWNSVPAQMQMLLHVLEADTSLRLPTLSRAMLSGDWIPPALPPHLQARLPHLRLYSLGGATEASIWSIVHPIDKALPDWPSIPYGKPLANQSFHVLDASLADCPDWVTGELYIGGIGLALGYLGDTARTAERFIHHPRSGARLYRTGDLGRYRPGGLIEFLGREDSQVKIRGYRIELAEIEAALQDCPGIAAAAALVEGDTPMDRRLAAFVQPGPAAVPPPPFDAPALPVDAAASTRALSFTEALNTVARLGFHHALQQAGNLPAQGDWGDTDAITAALRVAPAHRALLRRWLALLTGAGLLVAHDGRHACPRAVDEPMLAAAWADVERLRVEAGYQDTLQRHLAIAARETGALLRGEIAPTDVFFPNGDTAFAQAVYAETLVGQRVNEAVTALVRGAARTGTQPLRVLEIGAGVGGTSAALIPALADLDVDYLFTDVSRFFLNRAADVFAAWPLVRFGLFDINEGLREQGLRPQSLDVIVASNVLHNARDLPGLLRGLGGLLRPGGRLVIVETVEEIAWTMASMEFMVSEDAHAGGDRFFHSEADWTRLLAQAAGADPIVLPRRDDPLHAVGQRVFAVRFKAGTATIDEAALQAQLAARLPPYMLPQRLEVVDALPLTDNGKVDRKTMRAWLGMGATTAHATDAVLLDPLEQRLGELWSEVLAVARIGRRDSFFQIGGDSLLVSQLASRLHERFAEAKSLQFSQTMRQILRHPTIAELADFLRQAGQTTETAPAEAPPASPVTPLGEVETGPACVLVHELGGTMAPYLDLIRELKTQVPLSGLAVTKVAVYLERDPAALVDDIADEYVHLLAERPPAQLVGYGMSGLLTVAIAARLAERGAPPVAVTVIGGCGTTGDMQDELALEYAFCRFIGIDPARAGYPAEDTMRTTWDRRAVRDDAPALQRLRSLSAEQRLATIAAGMAGDREGIDALGYARAHLSLFRQSLAAYARFRPAPFAGDIRLLLPEDPTPALPWLDSDVEAFWREQCLGEVTVERIPGSHFSCLKGPHAAGVARLLESARAVAPA